MEWTAMMQLHDNSIIPTAKPLLHMHRKPIYEARGRPLWKRANHNVLQMQGFSFVLLLTLFPIALLIKSMGKSRRKERKERKRERREERMGE